MKRFLLVLLFALTSIGSLVAQESVIIKEPSEQCYQDLKANLPEAVRWDDNQHMVLSRPLATLVTGNVQLYARIFQEAGDTKCKLTVGFDSPEHQAALNSNTSFLFQNAHLLAARIETARKAREKAEKKKEKEQAQEKDKDKK